MLCPHCGTSTTADARSCGACRRPLPGRVAATATLTPPPAGAGAESAETDPAGLEPTPPPLTGPDSEAETRLSNPADSLTDSAIRRADAPPPGSGLRSSPGDTPIGPLAPGEPFGVRYRVLRVLGAGGMGVVYKAWDEELGVAVALKIVRPEITAEPFVGQEMERRFKRELLLAREVTHRNVVRIHDLGDVDGIKYISMPFIEGQSLAARLTAASKLAVPEALKIARQVAAGLAAAHEAGVVHRDLKPENVMLDREGRAVIMDFGISRSTMPDAASAQSAASEPEGHVEIGDTAHSGLLSGMTTAGAVIGTLEYMAPEQARAEPVDQRADIYSFGLLFRDMLLGNVRLAGKTALDELKGRMEHAPAAPRSIDSHIPGPVDEVIRRCIEPDAAARFQTSRELVAALDRLDGVGQLRPEPRRFGRSHLAAAVALVTGLVGGTWWFASRLPPPEPAPVSVLIADFDNRANDPAFNGSLEQALTMALEEASFVNPYARETARNLAQLPSEGKLDENAARLVSVREGINVVLAGTVQPANSGYTIAVRAISPANGEVRGTATASADNKEQVLQAVGSVAARIRAILGDTADESVRLAASETVTAASLDAIRDYSHAQDLLYQSKDEEAIVYYKRAIASDPNFGRAYSGWAISAQNLGRREEALNAWNKAVSLTDRMTDREKNRTMGNYYIAVPKNYEKAVESLKRVVDQYPYDRGGQVNIAIAYFYMRNFAKALEHGRRSVEIAPKDVINRANLALYGMYAGDFATAADEARAVLTQDATAYRSYLPLAMAAIAKGDFEAARSAYADMSKSGPPGSSLATLGLADLALYQGRFHDAGALLIKGIVEDQARANTSGLAAKSVALAESHLGEGKTRLAIDAARRALKLLGTGPTAVPAARVLIAAGVTEEPRTLAAALADNLQPEFRAYARLLEGEIALRDRRYVAASEALLAGQALADLWWSRLALGIAYVEAGHPAEALGELELCRKRQGEATAIMLDDLPSIRYLAPLPYWLARAQEAVGQTTSARASYSEFIRIRSGDVAADPLVQDARRRLEAVGGTETTR
jgi:serine/threonine protein kinase/Tfp pilus assembly protein PilF